MGGQIVFIERFACLAYKPQWAVCDPKLWERGSVVWNRIQESRGHDELKAGDSGSYSTLIGNMLHPNYF